MGVKRMNPSAILSKKMIIEALLDMLAVKSLSSISISEIAENALVDRRTFYRHFKSKNDVIKYYIHDVLIQYEQIISHYNVKDTYSLAKAIFKTLLNLKEALLILCKQNLLDLLLTNFEIIYKKYQYQCPEILNLENIDYIMAFERGGIINIVKLWITEGCKHSPEEMGAIIKQMLSFFEDTTVGA